MCDAAKKAVYHRGNFSAFLMGRDEAIQPVSVEVVPSLECNFNCKGCTYAQNGSKRKDISKGGSRLMSQQTFDQILQGLVDMEYTKSIIFTGGGEPTMNPEYVHFIRQATREKSGDQRRFDVGLYTNGTLIGEHIGELANMGLTFIRVSLNAGRYQTHRQICRYGNTGSHIFDKITDNIVRLAKARGNHEVETTIGIGFIMARENSDDGELSSIKDLLLKLHEASDGRIDYAAFRPKVQYFDSRFQVVTSQPDKDTFGGIVTRLIEQVKDPLNEAGMDVLINAAAFNELAEDNPNTGNIASSWSASFDYDGGFYISSEHNGMDGFCIGHVTEGTSVGDVWGGTERTKIREEIERGEKGKPDRRTLHSFKLKSLNDLLMHIRKEIMGDEGFSDEEVREFYSHLDEDGFEVPGHINFI